MKIYDFEEFMIGDRFYTQVVAPFANRNPLYQNVRNKDRAIVFVQFKVYIYVFLKYVPKGEKVNLPSVEDSFEKIIENNRISKGEWVVEGFYKLEKSNALALYPLIYAAEKQEGWFDSLRKGIIDNQVVQEVKGNQTPSFLQKRI